MKIDELAELMKVTREEVEQILQTRDVIELDLTAYNSRKIEQRWLFEDDE